MAKKNIYNQVHIEGYLYEVKIEEKISGENSAHPGTKYLRGSIDIATDKECLNILTVRYNYVAPTYPSGKPNLNYDLLTKMMNGDIKNVMKNGIDEAAKLRIDSAINLNEFYSDKTGEAELVSVKCNDGGFIHMVNAIDENPTERNRFLCDMLITSVTRKEADEERQIPEKAILKGAIFDFRNALLPVEFSVTDPAGMDYFESMGASAAQPVFLKIWGNEISETIVTTITEESAFGAPSVREVKTTRKDFVVTGASPEAYEWDSEETLTAAEVKQFMADREIKLAELKARFEQSKSAPTEQASTIQSPAVGGFKF